MAIAAIWLEAEESIVEFRAIEFIQDSIAFIPCTRIDYVLEVEDGLRNSDSNQ